ncbi:Gfo/Idh/MocA family protein [Niabella beijingensis]|uniref:Gfo/Idh/MocA family protein n=1 Tax=Niabella beijingensis TaxID=2872700 RepID=UPI001CBF940C|nr:Gfo/Idh/MocA family oxidoreductase [Niabella beijingensis]MBZ4188618.1 Gfo/Idh/MocA family oxidoreductase [Niabella beijingensis]
MRKNFTRRDFLYASSLGTAGFLAGPSIGKAGIFKSTVNIGLIGVGQRGSGLLNLLTRVDGAKVTACCDIDNSHLQRCKTVVPDAKLYPEYQKLIQDRSVDAVIIATPLYLHYQIARDAIEAGKHIYVEKTMTYDIDQALKLEALSESRPQIIIQVGHQYRYYGMYPKIKKLIADGLIGKVTHYECQYNRNSDWRRPVTDPSMEKQVNWRMYKEFSGGPLAELSAHQIDIVNWLQDGHPLKAIGMGDVNFWRDGRTTFDNVRVIYDYEGGVKSSIVSVLSNEYNGYLTRILGSTGTIEMTRDRALLFPEKLKKEQMIVDGVTGATKEVLNKGEGIVIFNDTEKTEPTTFALRGFVKSVRDGQLPVSNVHTGKETAIAVHMGNAAAESGILQKWEDRYK